MSTCRPTITDHQYNKNNNEIFSLLLSLPTAVKETEIYPRINPASPLCTLSLLSQTSKQLEKETAFDRLMSASINATPQFMNENEDITALAAIAILKKQPELLFKKKKVTDHYGREIYASPYQIFLGAGDIWALRQVQEVILTFTENKTAEAQFKEQFPNCPWPLPENVTEEMMYDDRNKEQIVVIVKQLELIKEGVNADRHLRDLSDQTKRAIEWLCKLVQPKSGEVIRSGLHFPLAIMNEIDMLYKTTPILAHYFTKTVFKPVLDALSTADGQCCQYGFDEFDMEKGPNRRCDSAYKHPIGQPLSLTFVNDKHKHESVVVVDPQNGSVLVKSSEGFNSYSKKGQQDWMVYNLYRSSSTESYWKKLMENKSSRLSKLFCGHTLRGKNMSR